ncbi:MAG: SURF1 family protein [Gammaproteobacteria bacterium]|nr:SURF1 family protein [Gammaproteobacteria bacterium]
MIIRKMFSRSWIVATLLVVVAASVCVRLGIWQLDRLAETRAFNAHVYAVRAMQPLDLPAQIDLTTMEWRAVHLSGTYDFENQVAIRNQFNGDQFGYHLITPLHLSDGTAVLVDRGWIPADGNSAPADWRKYDQPGQVALSGIVRLSETNPPLGGASDPTLTPDQTRLDFWIFVNVGRIGSQIPYPVLPVYIQLDPKPNQSDPPIPFQPTLDLSEGSHQSYAYQWFSFAALFIIGYSFYVNKQESKKK